MSNRSQPTPRNKPKATVRMQLEAHATHTICASCHHKIDPLGFAFDNFDAIGRWRTDEKVHGGKGDNPPVNASGALATGEPSRGRRSSSSFWSRISIASPRPSSKTWRRSHCAA